VDPEIVSGLKQTRKQSEEKAVEEVRNLKDGTRRRLRKPSSERNRKEPGSGLRL